MATLHCGCIAPTPVQCHCSVCHNTFGTISSFDRHRKDGQCLSPQGIGLVLKGHVWRFPADDRSKERMER